VIGARTAASSTRARSRPEDELYGRARDAARRDRVIEATRAPDARSRFEVPPPYPARLAQILVKEGAASAKASFWRGSRIVLALLRCARRSFERCRDLAVCRGARRVRRGA